MRFLFFFFNYLGTSVCQGDSGGGYVFELNDKYYLRGIVSVSPQSQTQYTCDSNHYTLFTKVSKYEDFIYEYESKHRPIIWSNTTQIILTGSKHRDKPFWIIIRGLLC